MRGRRHDRWRRDVRGLHVHVDDQLDLVVEWSDVHVDRLHDRRRHDDDIVVDRIVLGHHREHDRRVDRIQRLDEQHR
jgi:hypothetical protein